MGDEDVVRWVGDEDEVRWVGDEDVRERNGSDNFLSGSSFFNDSVTWERMT